MAKKPPSNIVGVEGHWLLGLLHQQRVVWKIW
jgi:hypothetical protein